MSKKLNNDGRNPSTAMIKKLKNDIYYRYVFFGLKMEFEIEYASGTSGSAGSTGLTGDTARVTHFQPRMNQLVDWAVRTIWPNELIIRNNTQKKDAFHYVRRVCDRMAEADPNFYNFDSVFEMVKNSGVVKSAFPDKIKNGVQGKLALDFTKDKKTKSKGVEVEETKDLKQSVSIKKNNYIYVYEEELKNREGERIARDEAKSMRTEELQKIIDQLKKMGG